MGFCMPTLRTKGINILKIRERLPAFGAHADQEARFARLAEEAARLAREGWTPLTYRKPSISIRSLLGSSIWVYKMVRSSGETAKPTHI